MERPRRRAGKSARGALYSSCQSRGQSGRKSATQQCVRSREPRSASGELGTASRQQCFPTQHACPSSRPSVRGAPQRPQHRRPEAGPEVPAAAGKGIRAAGTRTAKTPAAAGAGTSAAEATKRQRSGNAAGGAEAPATDAAIAAKARTAATAGGAATAATAESGSVQASELGSYSD